MEGKNNNKLISLTIWRLCEEFDDNSVIENSKIVLNELKSKKLIKNFCLIDKLNNCIIGYKSQQELAKKFLKLYIKLYVKKDKKNFLAKYLLPILANE